MRTSLNNLRLAEEYLLGKVSTGDALVFEARLIINPELQQDVDAQRLVYKLVREYGRRELKLELENVHQELFTDPKHRSFRKRVMKWFRKD